MSYFVERLPEELVGYVKDFVLSVDIKLLLLYQKYEIDEKFIKKMLKGFNSKQLETINWKYLYYKIFKVSPPRCDNRNLAAIFDDIEEEYPSYYDYVRTNGDISYSEPKYKLCNKSVKGFCLAYAITRSDYYSENVRTEMGRKRQQNSNIMTALRCIKNGRWSSDLDEFNWYMCNVEYELLRVLMVLSSDIAKVAKSNKKRANK
jgi:Tfp pilus assembly major pilin PilA